MILFKIFLLFINKSEKPKVANKEINANAPSAPPNPSKKLLLKMNNTIKKINYNNQQLLTKIFLAFIAIFQLQYFFNQHKYNNEKTS